MPFSARRWLWFACLAMLGALVGGCGAAEQTPAVAVTAGPTPTTSSIFNQTSQPQATAAAKPSAAPAQPTAISSTPVAQQAIVEVPVYTDALAQGWSLRQTSGANYNLAGSAFVQEGKAAAVITPTKDFGSWFLTVTKQSRASYPSAKVIGVSFWLNSGTGAIATSDLAVTVVGSDKYPYWVAGDVLESQAAAAESPFSETRLYDLGINRTIPPDTWVEITVVLDELQYDPPYTYVTGMYIKNDEGFTQPFYIDNVRLLMVQG